MNESWFTSSCSHCDDAVEEDGFAYINVPEELAYCSTCLEDNPQLGVNIHV